jgi:hypothetical protein
VHISHFPYVCYMFNPSHPPWFYHLNNIWWRVKFMKLLIMEFSPTSCYFLYFGPNILSSLFLHTVNLCSSDNVRIYSDL